MYDDGPPDLDVGAAKTMIERTEERFTLTSERLAADTANGAAPKLNWLVEEKDIAPHPTGRSETTSDVYPCPKQRNYSHVQSDRRGTRRMEASGM